MRFRFPLLLILTFLVSACESPMAPKDPAKEVVLGPFYRPIIYTSAIGDYYDFNYLQFYAPAGVDPIVEATETVITTNSPDIVIDNIWRTPGNVEGDGRVLWRITIVFRARALGEAEIKVCLRANPKQCSSFRVIAQYI